MLAVCLKCLFPRSKRMHWPIRCFVASSIAASTGSKSKLQIKGEVDPDADPRLCEGSPELSECGCNCFQKLIFFCLLYFGVLVRSIEFMIARFDSGGRNKLCVVSPPHAETGLSCTVHIFWEQLIWKIRRKLSRICFPKEERQSVAKRQYRLFITLRRKSLHRYCMPLPKKVNLSKRSISLWSWNWWMTVDLWTLSGHAERSLIKVL